MRFLDKYSAREKQLRRLEREVDRLRQAKGAAPVIPLERPYQRGWIKTYAIEERIAARPDAAVFRAVHRVVNQAVYSRDRAFVHRSGQPIILRPYIIPRHEWLKLAWPASHQRFFAYGTWRIEDAPFRLPPHRATITGFKLFQIGWLREVIQPALVTHQRVDLPDVKSRLAWIDSHMIHTAGWQQLRRLHGQKFWWGSRTTRAGERADQALADQLQSFIPD